MADAGKLGLKPAFAYLCQRAAEEQRRVIYAFASMSGFEIVREFEDLASGVSEFGVGPGLLALLRLVGRRGIKTVIVDSAERFSPDPTNQVVTYLKLQERGIELIAADSPAAFVKEATVAERVKQVLEVTSKIDTSIEAAKSRKRVYSTSSEPWRKTYAEFAPVATALAKRLHEGSRKKGVRMSLREISAELAAAGHLNGDGKPFHPEAVRRMINGRAPKLISKE